MLTAHELSSKNWFFHFLKKAVTYRKGRFAIASTAVTLAVAIVTALVTLTTGIRDRIGAELKAYGANMIVTDGRGGQLDDATAAGIETISPDIRDSAIQIYGTAMISSETIEVIGVDMDKISGFRIRGKIPTKDDEIMAGINLREAHGIQAGDEVSLSGRSFLVTGIFEKGSDEDFAVIMTITAARSILKVEGASAVLLNVDPARLEDVERKVASRYPFAAAKTLRQVAVAEERLLGRIQLLMVLVTIVVLFSSVIALGSTMGANVIERTGEIGLMKAMGATRQNVRNFFMAEAGLSGIAGAAAGCMLGVGVAEAVSRAAFDAFIPVSMYIPVLAVVVGIVIAVIATFFPVRDAMRMVPAEIMRGE